MELKHGENQNKRKEAGLGEWRAFDCITPTSRMVYVEVLKMLVAFSVLSSKL